MSQPSRYGPNQTAVERFLGELKEIPWFTRLGQPTDRDSELVRVDFGFLAQHHGDPYAPWGQSLIDAESAIEQLVFEHHRLAEFTEIQTAVEKRGPDPYTDDFFTSLVDKYPGYYSDTGLYAHELVDVPNRLIWGTALEIMLADVAPTSIFFQSIMPWFRAGHWPCGWDGTWPNGKLILW